MSAYAFNLGSETISDGELQVTLLDAEMAMELVKNYC